MNDHDLKLLESLLADMADDVANALHTVTEARAALSHGDSVDLAGLFNRINARIIEAKLNLRVIEGKLQRSTGTTA